MTDPRPIRSYQSIFSPERRLHQVEGRTLPVPGGVPLRWLAWATGALLAALALASGSPLVLGVSAAAGALAGLAVGGRGGALAAGVAALADAWLAGAVLGALDWPLRLVVFPIAVATLATQTTPDGRRAERFAASWLALRLSPRRRSAGRALPAAGARRNLGGGLWVAPDHRAARLRRCRLRGPATVRFAAPVELRRCALRRGRLLVRPQLAGDGATSRAGLDLVADEVAEVRP